MIEFAKFSKLLTPSGGCLKQHYKKSSTKTTLETSVVSELKQTSIPKIQVKCDKFIDFVFTDDSKITLVSSVVLSKRMKRKNKDKLKEIALTAGATVV